MSLFQFVFPSIVIYCIANDRSYNQPIELKNVTATLESGSGVNDSYITANIHVRSGGLFWSGGNLQVTNTQQDFIYAFSPNSPSGGASGNIKQHVSVGTFTLDLTNAIGAGGMPTIVSPATGWGWSSTVLAHAVMMGIAWVGALPAGAIIIRFLNKKVENPVLVHQILQLSALGMVFIAFFVGVGLFPILNLAYNRRLHWTTFPICSSMVRANSIPWNFCPSGLRILPSQPISRG
jgi:hypothetical protein